MRGLLITLLFLIVLLVAADRVALLVAEHVVATQLQSTGTLSARPSVSIRGIPFLTQAVAGRYDDVEVTASNVTSGRERLSSFQASLRGLHLPLSQALSGSVARVPVDLITSRVVLSYAELQARLANRDLTLSAAEHRRALSHADDARLRTLLIASDPAWRLAGAAAWYAHHRERLPYAAADGSAVTYAPWLER